MAVTGVRPPAPIPWRQQWLDPFILFLIFKFKFIDFEKTKFKFIDFEKTKFKFIDFAKFKFINSSWADSNSKVKFNPTLVTVLSHFPTH